VADFAIRAPSVDDLLDPYSVEPLEARPLTDEIRDRILEAWVNTRDERPEQLTVELPAELRSDELARKLQSAIREDLRETSVESSKLRIYSHSELRQAQIAFAFLVACLFASNLVDRTAGDDGLADSIAQGLVVLGWVAMWGPADHFFKAVTRRLNHKRYAELAEVPIAVSWN
jgi:hypothetical protein